LLGPDEGVPPSQAIEKFLPLQPETRNAGMNRQARDGKRHLVFQNEKGQGRRKGKITHVFRNKGRFD
jgi:hypothetical protein